MLSSSKNEVKDMFNIFERFLNTGFQPLTEDYIKINVVENENEYNVKAEIPGARKEEIQIEFKDGNLNIQAQRKSINNLEEENYVYKEISEGKMIRTIYLKNASKDGIKAKYVDGLLEITILKIEGIDDYNKNRIPIE